MLIFGLLGTLTFLVLFVYFYKTSGKFRQAVLAAFVAVAVSLSSSQPAQAGEADAFTAPNQQHQSRPQKQGFFSSKSNNDGSGPGKPNDFGSGSDDNDSSIPQYSQPESVEQTEERIQRIEELMAKFEDLTDTDSESEIETENECKSTEQNSVREITGHDGVKGTLTDKSTNHLTSNHGHYLGIDDPLPLNPNQKTKKYKQIRTRINKENKEKFGDIVEEILRDPNTEPYPGISIRGVKSHGYYTENYGESGFFIGIHSEGEFKGQIKKAQPISDKQLKTLQEENRID